MTGFKIMSLSLMASLLIASAAVGQTAIFANDFEDDAVGPYTVSNWSADWSGAPGETGIEEGRATIVSGDAAFNGGRSLRLLYPKGSVGAVGPSGGGAEWRMNLGQSHDELYLSYRIRFGADFDFVLGGKLPGLAGGAGNTGGNTPNGTDGWSARMMWVTYGPAPGDRANAIQYVYHPDQPGTFGHNIRWDDTADGSWAEFEADRWYSFQHRIIMNTPGQYDGAIQAWLDGELVLDMDGLRFRDVATLGVDQLLFSTFFGGGSANWAPTKDEFIFFDDFVVSTGPITVPEPSLAISLAIGAGALAALRFALKD
ncbi:MAG: polysaccharide lyase [Myxococcota bacterium]